MSNSWKARLMLMSFGLNLSAAVIHLVLKNYIISSLCVIISYGCFEYVVQQLIKGDENEQAS